MKKAHVLSKIKEIYDQKKNIIRFLKEMDQREYTSVEDIMISYDFQAGAYTNRYHNRLDFLQEYAMKLAQIIDQLGTFDSLLEAGVGEATTLGPLLSHLNHPPESTYGFDISWSRVKYARKFLESIDQRTSELFVGDLFNIPLKDNSVDVVYTSHSIEPNGGREKEALVELYRVARKYIILLEPSYEFADEKARSRMIEHGYIRNLEGNAKDLGYNVIEHRLFGLSANALNPTGLIIIEKKEDFNNFGYQCPITKTELIQDKNAYFSTDALIAYPTLDNIPCLLPEHAILATKFLE
jgi:ubiquinone/menaquinone biosynthesis C-methylase UbiE